MTLRCPTCPTDRCNRRVELVGGGWVCRHLGEAGDGGRRDSLPGPGTRVALVPVDDAGRQVQRICDEAGVSVGAGLFSSREAALRYCDGRRWEVVSTQPSLASLIPPRTGSSGGRGVPAGSRNPPRNG